jgi:hypothetical protein
MIDEPGRIARDADALAALFDEDAEFVNVVGVEPRASDERLHVHRPPDAHRLVLRRLT